MSTVSLPKEEIETALAELDGLAQFEYGVSLKDLLSSKDPVSPLRVQRLVGISLKRKFVEEGPATTWSMTGAAHSYAWQDFSDSLEPIKKGEATQELALLEELRKPGPWNERTEQLSWGSFKSEVEHERGLFKLVALYAWDKFNKQQTRKLNDYFEAEESPDLEFGLNLAGILFDVGVIGPLATLLGANTVAVGVALIGLRYGYRKLSDPNEDYVSDNRA